MTNSKVQAREAAKGPGDEDYRALFGAIAEEVPDAEVVTVDEDGGLRSLGTAAEVNERLTYVGEADELVEEGDAPEVSEAEAVEFLGLELVADPTAEDYEAAAKRFQEEFPEGEGVTGDADAAVGELTLKQELDGALLLSDLYAELERLATEPELNRHYLLDLANELEDAGDSDVAAAIRDELDE